MPGFVHVLNEARTQGLLRRASPPPWFLKPRQQAGAIGIRKIAREDELWAAIDELGDRSSQHLLETYVAGDVFHVDSIVYEREVRVAVASRYGTPPFDVSHGGGVFTSRLVERGTDIERRVLDLNRKVLALARAGARGLAQRVHPPRERRVRLSGDIGPGRRRAHRRARGGGDRAEPVGGVGEDREGGRGRAIRSAPDAGRSTRG